MALLIPAHHIEDDMAAVQRYVKIAVNKPPRRISVSKLLRRDDEIE